jgi:hypothetical protein
MHDSNVFNSDGKQYVWRNGQPIPKLIQKDDDGIDWDWPSDIREHPGYWKVIGTIHKQVGFKLGEPYNDPDAPYAADGE